MSGKKTSKRKLRKNMTMAEDDNSSQSLNEEIIGVASRRGMAMPMVSSDSSESVSVSASASMSNASSSVIININKQASTDSQYSEQRRDSSVEITVNKDDIKSDGNKSQSKRPELFRLNTMIVQGAELEKIDEINEVENSSGKGSSGSEIKARKAIQISAVASFGDRIGQKLP